MVNERLIKSMAAVAVGAAQPALLKRFVFPNIGGDGTLVPQLGPLGTYSGITTLATSGAAIAAAVMGMKGKGPAKSADTQEYLLEYATAALVSEIIQDYVIPMSMGVRSASVHMSPPSAGIRRYDAGQSMVQPAPFIPANPVPFVASQTPRRGVF
jgi:hypothetical protein